MTGGEGERGSDIKLPSTEIFDDFIQDMDNLNKLIDLAIDGIARETQAVGMVEWLADFERLKAERDKTPIPVRGDEHERRMAHAKERADFAQREVETDFPKLHALATIAIWSSLEAFFENLAVAYLAGNPSALGLDPIKRIRVSLADYESMTHEERLLHLVDQLQQEIKTPLKQGVARFEGLLAVFGLGGEVDESVRRDLYELSHVRNVLVHRAGVADRRICAACPWLGLHLGDKVVIGHADFWKYVAAAMKYVTLILRRLTRIERGVREAESRSAGNSVEGTAPENRP